MEMEYTIYYTDSVEEITTEMLTGFFEGWKKPHTPEVHLRILHNSDHIVLAIDREKNRVVGFIVRSALRKLPLSSVERKQRNVFCFFLDIF